MSDDEGGAPAPSSMVTGSVVREDLTGLGGGSSFEDGTGGDDDAALLAARKDKRRADREERRKEHRKSKKGHEKGGGGDVGGDGKDRVAAPAEKKEIKGIGDGDDVGPMVGPLPMRAEAVLRRGFATTLPPGMGAAHNPLGGVKSLERPFSRVAARDPDAAQPTTAERLQVALEDEAATAAASALPGWVRGHKDFGQCVARPLDRGDARRRAAQLRQALRPPPDNRPLSSVLMVATWLAEFTDLSLDGVRRRNLMAMARAMTMRRVKRRGKAIFQAGDLPTHLYIVIEGQAVTDATIPPPAPHVPRGRAGTPGGSPGGGEGEGSGEGEGRQATAPKAKPPLRPLTPPPPMSGMGVGDVLGPGRSFGYVSPVNAEEPRTDSVYAGALPARALVELLEFERAEAAAAAALAAWEEADLTLGTVTVTTGRAGGRPAPAPKRPPHLLLAVIPLDMFYEEAAPGLSAQANGFRPFVEAHVRPAQQWAESKSFVFARSLALRTFMPGDVVWRQGDPARSVAFVLGGTFALTREAVWDAGNSWPEGSKAPDAPRRVRTRKDGCSVVLETVSHVRGSEAAHGGMHHASPEEKKRAAAAAAEALLAMTAEEEAEMVIQAARKERADSKLPCSPVVVGEEPLLVARFDPDGDSYRHQFVEARRYTLRAVGPGLCTLLDLPRASALKFLPFKGAWACGLQRQAARRHVDDATVRSSARLRASFEATSGEAWGEKMAARSRWVDLNLHGKREAAAGRQAELAKADAVFAAAHGAAAGTQDGKGRQPPPAPGAKPRTLPPSAAAAPPRPSAGPRSPVFKGALSLAQRSTGAPVHGGLLSAGSVVSSTGSQATLALGRLPGDGVDVWGARASHLQQTLPRHQGKWGQGLGSPLPMLKAGVPGVQRGERFGN